MNHAKKNLRQQLQVRTPILDGFVGTNLVGRKRGGIFDVKLPQVKMIVNEIADDDTERHADEDFPSNVKFHRRRILPTPPPALKGATNTTLLWSGF